MPGLLRAVGRTAVVAGTATAVSNRVSRRQANRWQDQAAADQYAAEQAAPPPPAQDDTLERLKELGELKASGVLTEAEFEAQKAKILAGL
ncbi:MAG TPA: SHOCT domain-containing protein [Actinomycetota bacterium]|nr:SHOCT domain-containing protein [Actinomycetota bacterium]